MYDSYPLQLGIEKEQVGGYYELLGVPNEHKTVGE